MEGILKVERIVTPGIVKLPQDDRVAFEFATDTPIFVEPLDPDDDTDGTAMISVTVDVWLRQIEVSVNSSRKVRESLALVGEYLRSEIAKVFPAAEEWSFSYGSKLSSESFVFSFFPQ